MDAGMTTSQFIGKCGPCCSNAPTGRRTTALPRLTRASYSVQGISPINTLSVVACLPQCSSRANRSTPARIPVDVWRSGLPSRSKSGSCRFAAVDQDTRWTDTGASKRTGRSLVARRKDMAESVRNIAVLVGSLRKESLNRKMANAIRDMAPEQMKLEIVEIGKLPLYNADFEETPPSQWVQFRERIKSADAVLFVTPEYNRSVPAGLKNAIDVGSRPYGKSVWERKPAAVVSVSPGAIGGFGANHHLRQSCVFLNMPALQLCSTRGASLRKRARVSSLCPSSTRSPAGSKPNSARNDRHWISSFVRFAGPHHHLAEAVF